MEIFLTIMFAIIRLLDIISEPFFKCRAKNKKLNLPPIRNDLLKISATELASKIRRKQISSLDICEAYIERVKEVNPTLNAVVEDRFNEALKEAKQVNSYLQTTSLSEAELEKIKPLLGVPVTIKEACAVKGMTHCTGSLSRLGFTAENDAEAVAKLKCAGAIVLLVSNTPELCLSWETFNYITGRTNNPYDPTCTSGGSSGGEGALLGSAASLIGIGSDVAGSIRLPALFCGVFGHKPTSRIISIKGHWPMGQDDKYNDYLVVGPMARYACDLKLMMKVLCNDKTSAELRLNESVDLTKLNVFFIEDIRSSVIQPYTSQDIKGVIEKSVKHLKEFYGSTIKDYKFKSFDNSWIVCNKEITGIEDTPYPFKWEACGDCFDLFKSPFGKSRYTWNLWYFYILDKLYKLIVSDYSVENEKMKKEVVEKLDNNGVIILPTFIDSACKHNQMNFKVSYSHLSIANALGLPATSVPCGFDKEGMPIGVQVLAAPHQDRLCLAVAEALERYFGGWIEPPE
ncbi:unnamed protein product [Ceutorhynchus assimilis]|uniref:Amidase domain-containing protein n=1 Tax=Ceutorhynchus assimilis TaxID=467358 RepID=A0A9N9N009_9CUCU|nr:unnamed protein product [Ceutorhynchus assimilis]